MNVVANLELERLMYSYTPMLVQYSLERIDLITINIIQVVELFQAHYL